MHKLQAGVGYTVEGSKSCLVALKFSGTNVEINRVIIKIWNRQIEWQGTVIVLEVPSEPALSIEIRET